MSNRAVTISDFRPAYTYADTARILGISRYKVARLVRSRELDTVKIGVYPAVTRASIRRFLQSTLADEAPELLACPHLTAAL